MVKIVPWDKWKACPKCDHPNLGTGTYYAATGEMKEHLAIKCSVCGHCYRMEPKS